MDQRNVGLGLLGVGVLLVLVMAYFILSYSAALGFLLIVLLALAVLVIRKNRGLQTRREQQLFNRVNRYKESAQKAYKEGKHHEAAQNAYQQSRRVYGEANSRYQEWKRSERQKELQRQKMNPSSNSNTSSWTTMSEERERLYIDVYDELVREMKSETEDIEKVHSLMAQLKAMSQEDGIPDEAAIEQINRIKGYRPRAKAIKRLERKVQEREQERHRHKMRQSGDGRRFFVGDKVRYAADWPAFFAPSYDAVVLKSTPNSVQIEFVGRSLTKMRNEGYSDTRWVAPKNLCYIG